MTDGIDPEGIVPEELVPEEVVPDLDPPGPGDLGAALDAGDMTELLRSAGMDDEEIARARGLYLEEALQRGEGHALPARLARDVAEHDRLVALVRQRCGELLLVRYPQASRPEPVGYQREVRVHRGRLDLAVDEPNPISDGRRRRSRSSTGWPTSEPSPFTATTDARSRRAASPRVPTRDLTR